ncbi:chromosome replication/partitioning protein (plasmid) [Borrelia coriaceae]|uniref:Putative plasmid partition protein n=1 Tax=Borrelia coriaceae ATCC 43381 TaxID=1408429 RepID=W5SXF4_9SPIR|nr:chromosome replication/partitioning protein [Borrelia coriaceae]AHH11353.1 Putative plasmid partition protein [Borrelia coriaceae ATCC 43381]UPA17521.1 chromosome replication/partitioning protein [Borrelia coriaceae]
MDIIINKRNLETVDEMKSYYNKLKQKLKSNFQQEIYYKMEAIKILKEIKDNEYYKLDGYRIFEDFIKDYKLARSQAYDYLKIATALANGTLEENYVIENGITQTIAFLRTTSSKLKKSKYNLIKPLHLQLKSQESYDFYKKNAKFTGFILDILFSSKKDWLKQLQSEFEIFNEKIK